MSAIGGPGGIGGPKGPSGPSGPEGTDEVADAADAGEVDAARATRAANEPVEVGAAHAAKAIGGLEAMAAEIAAGKLTANEAIERLVDDIAGTEQLGQAEQAELRELLTDLAANDPYLQSLVGRA